MAGIDIAKEQIEMAKRLAKEANLQIDFQVSAAESTLFSDKSFDVVSAQQCWLYFNRDKTISEVRRLLVTGGLLMTSYFSWLPRMDRIARASEALILKHNPQWSSNDYDGYVPPLPEWALVDFNLRAMFYYDEQIPFTRESWL